MGVVVITSREVPLGGPRSMTVRRTLPQRARSLIGAWCFADHYGADDVGATGGMDVPPHPHTGLQTISWLFEGEIEHRDSGGVRALVLPGEANVMTAGAGIAHSEVSTPETRRLHGVQLWVALPESARHRERAFDHYVPEPTTLDGGGEARVMVGSLAGATSTIPAYTPLLGAEITLPPGATVALPVEPAFEHGVLVDAGTVEVDGVPLERAQLGYRAPGSSALHLANRAPTAARVMLLGGEPFTEPVLMWWNFVGRTDEEIREFREQWQGESSRFGAVSGYDGEVSRLPAPRLPTLRLKPRGSPPSPPGPGDRSAWG